eukprot:g4219.t1
MDRLRELAGSNPLLTSAAALGAAVLVHLQLRYRPPRVWSDAEAGDQRKKFKTNRSISGQTHEKDLPVGEHALQLYSLGTPNGVKVTILLEELAELDPQFEYDAHLVRIGGDQFGSGFCAINPNSKIPCMVDREGGASGKERVRLFESGSILVYLCDKLDAGGTFLPKDPAARAEVMNWLMWQMGSAPYLGGGFGHFYNYAPYKIKYAVDRFSMETKRQLHVLETLLAQRPYIAGERYSLADIAIWPWYGNLVLGRLYGADTFLNVDEDYPHVVQWANKDKLGAD